MEDVDQIAHNIPLRIKSLRLVTHVMRLVKLAMDHSLMNVSLVSPTFICIRGPVLKNVRHIIMKTKMLENVRYVQQLVIYVMETIMMIVIPAQMEDSSIKENVQKPAQLQHTQICKLKLALLVILLVILVMKLVITAVPNVSNQDTYLSINV
jgi:DMSO reductase anchor subunit